MIRVYLDHNIYQGIKHEAGLVYKNIHEILLANRDRIIVPYSPAHLSDLSRSQNGSEKQKKYLKEDLELISSISQDHCFVPDVKAGIAYPDVYNPHEYYDFSFANRKETTPYQTSSFEELFKFDDPVFDAIMEPLLDRMKSMPGMFTVDQIEQWKQSDFDMFPRTRKENTMYNMMEDIFQFIGDDSGSLYRKSGKMINEQLKVPSHASAWEHPMEQLEKNVEKHFKKSLREYVLYLCTLHGKNKEPQQNQVFATYFLLLDQFGYNRDKKYSNLQDDTQHAYYAAHTDIFVTNDKNLLAKANALYPHLNISTRVCYPEQFESIIFSLLPYNVERRTPVQQLLDEIEKGLVLIEGNNDELAPVRVQKINKPLLYHFNRLQVTWENEEPFYTRFDLYKKSDTYFAGFFFKELDLIISELVKNFGLDLFNKGLFDTNLEKEKILNKEWEGRVWKINDRMVLMVRIYEYPFGLSINVYFK